MAQAIYINGCTKTIPYTPGSAVAAGDVVAQGSGANVLLGVAPSAIAASTLGALQIDGVFDFAKDTSTAHAVGVLLYWDDTNNKVTETSTSNGAIGRCAVAAAAADPFVRVVLTPRA